MQLFKIGEKISLPVNDPLGKRKAIVTEIVTYEGIYPYYELKLLRPCKSKYSNTIYKNIGRSHKDITGFSFLK